jgi:hypothetical protein
MPRKRQGAPEKPSGTPRWNRPDKKPKVFYLGVLRYRNSLQILFCFAGKTPRFFCYGIIRAVPSDSPGGYSEAGSPLQDVAEQNALRGRSEETGPPSKKSLLQKGKSGLIV